MSRKDKEKWAKLRREQAKALMVKESSGPEDRDELIHNIVGRRRARRYARQNEALAKASRRDLIEHDTPPEAEEKTEEHIVAPPATPQSSESPARNEPKETERAATPPLESGVSPSQATLKDESDEPYHASTDLARDMERLAEEKRKNDDMLEVLEKHRQVIGEQADRVSRKVRRFRDAADASKLISERTSKSSEPVEASPGLLTTKQAEIRAGGRGFVNGRGATNGTGLVNGKGAINGMGLVNGTGMINGTRNGGRFPSRSSQKADFLKKWQFLAILVAIAVVVPSFIFLSYSGKSEIAIDGSFSEWANIAKFDMQGDAGTPELSVQEWAIQSDVKQLYLYLKTEAGLMSSSDVDSFYLFVDSDNNPSSGYAASGIGADYMLELHGWDGRVESSSVSSYGPSGDQHNWSGWISIDSLVSALESKRLEAMASMPIVVGEDARFLLLAQNNLPNQLSSVSYVVSAKGGTLVIRQEPGTGIASAAGTIEASSSVSLLRLVLSCEGEAGTIRSITPVVSGATLVAPIADITLSPGEQKTADVIVDSSTCQVSDLVSAMVIETLVNSTFSEVAILGEGAKGYVTSPPASIQIDGAFGDWAGRVSPDNDTQPVGNPNIDIAATGYADMTSDAAFYVSVQGQICQGAFAPTSKGKPTTMDGGGTVIPSRKTGEDMLRINIDSDMSESTGQLVAMANKTVGADYAIEIVGIYGKIVSKSIMQFTGTEWVQLPASISAVMDAQRIELSVSSASIGGSSPMRFIVETTDWRQRTDLAWGGDQPDPLAITSSGDAYASTTGASWDFLGAPALEPGDTVVDATTNPARDIIYAVTNSGRTYQWIVGTSSSWSSNLTDAIASPANVVAIAMYADAGAFILTSDSRPFYNGNLITTRTWTARAVIPGPDVDFIDLEWRSGSTASTANLYAMRSAQDSEMWFTDDGGTTPFAKVGAKTGKYGPRTQFALIPGAARNQDQLFILQENGVISYSSNGGGAWSTRGDLPTPGVGNESRYIGISIDASSVIWVITDTGYCYKSTDGAQTFVYVGQTPASPIVAFATPLPIPEFGLPFAAIAIMSIALLASIARRKKA